MLMVAAALVAPVGAHASGAPIRAVGFLDRRGGLASIAANGNVVIDHEARRIYQAVISDETTLYEYDLDTLAELRAARLPGFLAAQTTSGPVEWLWSLDAPNDRLFAFHAGLPSPDSRLEDHPLLVVDLTTMKASEPRFLWPAADRAPIAVTYDAPSDRLYVMTRIKLDVVGYGVFALEERATDGRLIWEHQLPACFGAMDHQYPPTLARSLIDRSAIYLNCYNARNIQAQVVRVRLGADGSPNTEEIYPAVPGALSTVFDPGSDRMFFLTTNSGAGRGAWVFDGRRSSFIGVIATGDDREGASDYSIGLDPLTGRLYMQTPAGFVVADARRTPLPAGLLFRGFAGFGTGMIKVDPLTRRAFVLDPNSVNSVGQASRYVILRDAIPRSSDPPLGDPDALTTDITERAGVTASNISGAARAFGFRSLTTGGAQKAAWNAALGLFEPESLFSGAVIDALNSLPIDQRNRDLYAARVRSVTLTGDAADAAATAGDADAGTEKDFTDRSLAWPLPATECHDAGTKPDTTTGIAGTSGTSCDARAASVVASAGLPGVEVGGVVAKAVSAWTSINRDPARGLVARSIGLARDVSILGRVRIGEIRTESEAWAHGRPKTAGARFVRTIADVRIDAEGDGTDEFRCDVCDPTGVRDAVNRALAGQAAIEFPEPDPAYYPDGSKGGYQAVVEKFRFRAYAERALNDDESPEVAGMQIVVFADARAGRSRQIVQLAAVQAEAHYGIFRLAGEGSTVKRPGEVIVVPSVGPLPTIAPGAPSVDRGARPRVIHGVERIVERIATGVGVALTSPRHAALLAALWSFFALPAYLMRRRRAFGAIT